MVDKHWGWISWWHLLTLSILIRFTYLWMSLPALGVSLSVDAQFTRQGVVAARNALVAISGDAETGEMLFEKCL